MYGAKRRLALHTLRLPFSTCQIPINQNAVANDRWQTKAAAQTINGKRVSLHLLAVTFSCTAVYERTGRQLSTLDPLRGRAIT